MSVKMQDVAQHIHNHTSLKSGVETLIDSVISAFSGVSNTESRDKVTADLQANKSALVDSIFANIGGAAGGRRLGPGETPVLPGDHSEAQLVQTDRQRSDAAEAIGNPILPRDASGHKVHPADAFSQQPALANDRTATSFGGSGAGVEASTRNDAALTAASGDAFPKSALDRRAQAESRFEEYRVAAEKGIAAQRQRDIDTAANGPVT